MFGQAKLILHLVLSKRAEDIHYVSLNTINVSILTLLSFKHAIEIINLEINKVVY